MYADRGGAQLVVVELVGRVRVFGWHKATLTPSAPGKAKGALFAPRFAFQTKPTIEQVWRSIIPQ